MADFEEFGTFTYVRHDGYSVVLYVWIQVDPETNLLNFIHVARDPLLDSGLTVRPSECVSGQFLAALNFVRSVPVMLPGCDWPSNEMEILEDTPFGQYQGGTFT